MSDTILTIQDIVVNIWAALSTDTANYNGSSFSFWMESTAEVETPHDLSVE